MAYPKYKLNVVSTNRLAFKPSFCTFNSLIESSKCTSWRRFTFCAEIGGYVNRSGRSMWIIRWRRDKVHNKCLVLLYVSKQKSKAQWTSVALGRRRGASPAGTHPLSLPTRWPRWYSRHVQRVRRRSLSLRKTEVNFVNNFKAFQKTCTAEGKWLEKWETPLWMASA